MNHEGRDGATVARCPAQQRGHSRCAGYTLTDNPEFREGPRTREKAVNPASDNQLQERMDSWGEGVEQTCSLGHQGAPGGTGRQTGTRGVVALRPHYQVCCIELLEISTKKRGRCPLQEGLTALRQEGGGRASAVGSQGVGQMG